MKIIGFFYCCAPGSDVTSVRPFKRTIAIKKVEKGCDRDFRATT